MENQLLRKMRDKKAFGPISEMSGWILILVVLIVLIVIVTKGASLFDIDILKRLGG